MLAPEEESAFAQRHERAHEPAGESFAGALLGDGLAGIAAASAKSACARRWRWPPPPKAFLAEPVIPYEIDEVTRLICDSHDAAAFAAVSHLTVGEFREWLHSEQRPTETLAALAPGITPEMAAAVSKLMRKQDLVLAATNAGW